MKQRNFVFEVPAKVSISVQAATEIEAWIQIRSKATPEQFSATKYGEENWFTCTVDWQQAQLMGYEMPDDGSGRWLD